MVDHSEKCHLFYENVFRATHLAEMHCDNDWNQYIESKISELRNENLGVDCDITSNEIVNAISKPKDSQKSQDYH